MAETAAIIGAATTIGYSATLGGSYTLIGEVMDAKPPEVTSGKAEATHYLSPNTAKEFIPGWFEGGDATVKINYVKTQSATLYGLVGIKKFWKITTTDTAIFTFEGWISKLGTQIPLGERIEQELSITITGLPTMA